MKKVFLEDLSGEILMKFQKEFPRTHVIVSRGNCGRISWGVLEGIPSEISMGMGIFNRYFEEMPGNIFAKSVAKMEKPLLELLYYYCEFLTAISVLNFGKKNHE